MSQTQLLHAYDEVVSFLASGPTREAIASFRLSDETVARVRDLLRESSAGTLTPDEAEELDQCVQLDRILLLIRSQAAKQQHEVPQG